MVGFLRLELLGGVELEMSFYLSEYVRYSGCRHGMLGQKPPCSGRPERGGSEYSQISGICQAGEQGPGLARWRLKGRSADVLQGT